MKTAKPTVGYSRHQTVMAFTVKNSILIVFLPCLLAPAQAVGDRVYHE